MEVSPGVLRRGPGPSPFCVRSWRFVTCVVTSDWKFSFETYCRPNYWENLQTISVCVRTTIDMSLLLWVWLRGVARGSLVEARCSGWNRCGALLIIRTTISSCRGTVAVARGPPTALAPSDCLAMPVSVQRVENKHNSGSLRRLTTHQLLGPRLMNEDC